MTAPSQTPTPVPQPMPMDRAILWNPVKKEGAGRPSGRAPYPVFFQQEAVVALQDHLKASPQQAIFGFLIGTLYRDPDAPRLTRKWLIWRRYLDRHPDL